MVTSEGVVSDLVAIIGKESVSGDIFNRVTYGQDAFGPDLEKEKVPIAVVRPESAQQVSKLLVYANKQKIPVYVRGSGTAFKGSSRPKREGSIILSMEKFTSNIDSTICSNTRIGFSSFIYYYLPFNSSITRIKGI